MLTARQCCWHGVARSCPSSALIDWPAASGPHVGAGDCQRRSQGTIVERAANECCQSDPRSASWAVIRILPTTENDHSRKCSGGLGTPTTDGTTEAPVLKQAIRSDAQAASSGQQAAAAGQRAKQFPACKKRSPVNSLAGGFKKLTLWQGSCGRILAHSGWETGIETRSVTASG